MDRGRTARYYQRPEHTKFVWKNMVRRFEIPKALVSDNGTQFCTDSFRSFCAELHILQKFASVEHPQTNGLAEAANRTILEGLKKRLDSVKGLWAEQLPSVLWSYRTTVHTDTKETPFRLTFGQDAVIPVEIGQATD